MSDETNPPKPIVLEESRKFTGLQHRLAVRNVNRIIDTMLTQVESCYPLLDGFEPDGDAEVIIIVKQEMKRKGKS